MRVIGGEARGRKLFVPDLETLRPTSDRVREAMFDILEARAMVEGAAVADLFAGSGALGIEALSRGARAVIFVERDRRAVEAIERNLDRLGYGRAGQARGPDAPEVRVVQSDVVSWASLHSSHHLDLVMADPPYEFADWQVLLERLSARRLLVEHREPISVSGRYGISREYRYGGTLVTLIEDTRSEPAGSDSDPASEPVTIEKDPS